MFEGRTPATLIAATNDFLRFEQHPNERVPDATARLQHLLLPLQQQNVTLQLVSVMVFLRGLRPSMCDFVTHEYGRSATPSLDRSVTRVRRRLCGTTRNKSAHRTHTAMPDPRTPHPPAILP